MSKVRDCFIAVGYEDCEGSTSKHKNGKRYARDEAIDEAMRASSELDSGGYVKVFQHNLVTDHVVEIYTRSINA